LPVKSNPLDVVLEPVDGLVEQFDETDLRAWLSQRALDEPKAKLPEPQEAWRTFEEQRPYDPIGGEAV